MAPGRGRRGRPSGGRAAALHLSRSQGAPRCAPGGREPPPLPWAHGPRQRGARMSRQRMRDVHEDELHDHDRGLSFDVSTLMSRRRALQLLAVGGLATLVGCGTSSADSAGTTGATTTRRPRPPARPPRSSDEIPEETGGPYPADGSNGVNVLTESGIVRSDITVELRLGLGRRPPGCRSRSTSPCSTSQPAARPPRAPPSTCGTATATAATRCTTPRSRDENYLRGVQVADADGTGDVHQHLPRRLLGALAAHPLRGLPEPRRGDRGRLQAGDLAARAARGRLRARCTPPPATSRA